MLLDNLLGWTFILLLILSTLLLAMRWPGVARILWVALVVRVALVLFGYYIAPLPDSDGDAIGFELLAWKWSQDGFVGVLDKFRGPSTYFISWFIAVIYSLTDRSILMAQSVSILFGMGAVFMGWKLTRKLWGDRAATKAGWVLALFPTMVLYSVLILREAYVLFFMIVALYGVVDWSRTDRIKPILLAMAGFIGATFFHGAMIFGGIIFLTIVWLKVLREITKNIVVQSRKTIKSAFLSLFIVAGAYFFVSGGSTLPKVGDFDGIANIEVILSKIDGSTVGSDNEKGASYPEWATPRTPIELIYKGPIRIAYFIFSPFPWDISKFKHLVGFFDGLLYMALMLIIWRNRKVIWEDRALRNMLLIVISYLFIFGLIIGNFGTGIRHRSKFVGAIIVLAAPLLPKISFLKKNK